VNDFDFLNRPWDLGFYGLQLFADPNLTDTVEQVAVRTWGERLFGRPWRPWRKTKVVYVRVPSNSAYQIGNKVFAHPVMIQKLKEQVKEINK
jgi:hypothetical protein